MLKSAFTTFMAAAALLATSPALARIQLNEQNTMSVEVTEGEATQLASALQNTLKSNDTQSPTLSFNEATCSSGIDFGAINCYVRQGDSFALSVTGDDATALSEVLNQAERLVFKEKQNRLNRGLGDMIEVKSLQCDVEGEQTKCTIDYGTSGGAAGGAA